MSSPDYWEGWEHGRTEGHDEGHLEGWRAGYAAAQAEYDFGVEPTFPPPAAP